MPHWRTLVQTEYYCAADLWDEKAEKYRDGIFKIVKVIQGTVVGEKGRKRGLPFLLLENRHGEPLRAAFGANPTNATSVESAIGSPDYKRWLGRWIHMYVTKVDSPKGIVDAIRIHPKAPADPTKGDPPSNTDVKTGAPDLSDADKRAIELAEREEANRGR